jgi:hypothetical protein
VPEGDLSIHMTQARDVLAHGCRTAGAIGAWMRVTGEQSRQIRLIGNELSRARRAVESPAEVPPDAVVTESRQ